MTLNPRYSAVFCIIALVISGIVGAPATLSDTFGSYSPTILAWLTLFNIIINAINTVLHMIPSQDTPQAAKQFLLGPKNA